MNGSTAILKFKENEMIREVSSRISRLRKENNQEVLYTVCGLRIQLEQLLSINGIALV